MEAVFAEILKNGLFAALFLLAVLGLVSRDKSYREVQEKRIEESRQNTEKVLNGINAAADAAKQVAEALRLLSAGLGK